MRYYLRLVSSGPGIEADDPIERATMNEARDHALLVASELARNSGVHYAGYTLVVRDESGADVFTTPIVSH